MFDADKALEIARRSVHAFGTDKSCPYIDPPSDIISDSAFITLLPAPETEEEINELLENNPYE